MDAEQHEQVASIMQSLKKEPFALPFLDPLDLDDPKTEGILKILKTPIDLTTITSKLSNNEYKSIKEWKNDIDLIYSNSIKLYGKKGYITSLADVLVKECERLITETNDDPIRDWLNEIGNTSRKVIYLMSNMPENLIDYWTREFGDLSVMRMNERDISKMVKMSQKFTDESDAQAMFCIIHELNPNINAYSESVQLDLTRVNNKTHWALEWFLRKKCEDENINY